jgi:dTDP-glucose 4,6-dehydratase
METEQTKKLIFLTGAGGFVGSHVLSHLLKHTNHDIVCVCSWRHRGAPYRILDDENYQAHKERVKIVTHDLVSTFTEDVKRQIGKPDIILNIASDSHVDRSITDPVTFIQNNTNLVLTMLEFAREVKPELFLQFSTDEVYGQAPIGVDHAEWSPIVPSNPYSASKAAQEAIAISYWRTYGVPVIITNTMNVFGERQDAEKFVQLCIDRAVSGEKIYIHAYPDGKTAGSRFYIHARNVADAVLHIMDNVKPVMYPDSELPERFNVVGEKEVDNLTMAQMIAEMVGKPLNYELVDFHSSRPGHDCRYALDGKKLAEAGWTPKVSFEDSLKRTVDFTLNK